MSDAAENLWCEACGVEITWSAHIIEGHMYCCQECFEGIPCNCDARMALFEEDRRSNQTAVG